MFKCSIKRLYCEIQSPRIHLYLKKVIVFTSRQMEHCIINTCYRLICLMFSVYIEQKTAEKMCFLWNMDYKSIKQPQHCLYFLIVQTTLPVNISMCPYCSTTLPVNISICPYCSTTLPVNISICPYFQLHYRSILAYVRC